MSVPVRPHMVPTTASSPIGSSPAVCYTQYLPPESKADILLLDCGDPRSILYTIHCRSSLNFGEYKPAHGITLANTFKPANQVDPAFPILDFTCSDTNPVVLGAHPLFSPALAILIGIAARNILLLTLIADNTSGKDTQKIWNSFYHIYLDGASCNLIHAQAAKLHKMSWTIKQWNDGEYGYFIRFVNVDTMSKLRDYWDHWANVKNMSKAQKKRFKDKYQCGVRKTSRDVEKYLQILSDKRDIRFYFQIVQFPSLPSQCWVILGNIRSPTKGTSRVLLEDWGHLERQEVGRSVQFA